MLKKYSNFILLFISIRALNVQTTEVAEEEIEMHPILQNMGFYINQQAEGFGIDIGVVFDVNGGYRWPFFSANQYMVTNPKVRFQLGGKSWVTIILYMIKLQVFLDVNGYDITPFDYKVKLDVVDYKEVCHQLDWASQGLSFSVNG